MFWYLFLAASPIVLMPIVSSYYNTPIDSNNKAKKTYLFWCGLILFLMIALRDKSLGSVDSTNYYNNWIKLREMPFDKLPAFMEKSDMESGYLFTVWCISRIFYEPQFVFVLSGLLFSIAVCQTIYFNSENVMLSMVMYICLGLYMFMLQGLRQSIAISICLLATEHCKKRKFFPFLLSMLLAFLFHRTCIVFTIMYFVYGLKFTSKTKAGLLITAGVLVLLAPLFVKYGNQFLDRAYENTAQSSALIASAIYVIILAVAYLFLDKKNTNEELMFFIVMTLFGAAFYLMRYMGAQVMDRISFYFIMGQNIVLPAVIKKFDNKSKDIIIFVVCGLCILLFLYRLATSYGIVYLFFWQ